MKAVNIYLNFNGNTEEAFNFYKSVFGGEFVMVTRFKDTPAAGQVAAAEAGKIMYMSLPLSNGSVLMGTDALESMGHKITTGTNFHIVVSADSHEEADKLFDKLSAGGKVTVPLADQFWGAYFGQATDKFGTQWMISFDKNGL